MKYLRQTAEYTVHYSIIKGMRSYIQNSIFNHQRRKFAHIEIDGYNMSPECHQIEYLKKYFTTNPRGKEDLDATEMPFGSCLAGNRTESTLSILCLEMKYKLIDRQIIRLRHKQVQRRLSQNLKFNFIKFVNVVKRISFQYSCNLPLEYFGREISHINRQKIIKF